jgi:hypothetical protein
LSAATSRHACRAWLPCARPADAGWPRSPHQWRWITNEQCHEHEELLLGRPDDDRQRACSGCGRAPGPRALRTQLACAGYRPGPVPHDQAQLTGPLLVGGVTGPLHHASRLGQIRIFRAQSASRHPGLCRSPTLVIGEAADAGDISPLVGEIAPASAGLHSVTATAMIGRSRRSDDTSMIGRTGVPREGHGNSHPGCPRR